MDNSTYVNKYGDGHYEIIFNPQRHKKGRVAWTINACIIAFFACGLSSVTTWNMIPIILGFLLFLYIVRVEYEKTVIQKDILIEACITEINALANDESASLNISTFDPIIPGSFREQKYLYHVMRCDEGFPPDSIMGTNSMDEAVKMKYYMQKKGFPVEARAYEHTVSKDQCNTEQYEIINR